MSLARELLVDRAAMSRTDDAIVVIHPHALMQRCLVSALEGRFAEFGVVGLTTVGEIQRMAERSVRLVVLDIGDRAVADDAVRGDLSTVEQAFPGASILVLSERADAAATSAAMQRGLAGLLSASLTLEVAAAALRLVLAGGVYFPPAESQPNAPRPHLPMDGAMSGPARSAQAAAGCPKARSADDEAASCPTDGSGPATGGFTPREAQVLAALQRGRPNKLIANELSLSENTVKVHIRHIMRKLHATNRTEAVLIAQRQIPAPRLAYSS